MENIKKQLTPKGILNWCLDHLMIILIIALAIFVQTQRPAFFGTANLISLLQFTTARLPMALGVAGCIILAGTDLSGGRIAGLTGYLAAIMGLGIFANQPIVALILCMLAGGCIGAVNGFCMGKFKLHPFIVTLATQLITYGTYLTISNSVQLSMPSTYASDFATKTLFSIQTGVRANGTPILTKVPMFVLLAVIVTAIMWVVWNKTAFGKNMFAVGSNQEAARVSGVNVLMTIICVFILAGAMYGYTGFMEACRIGTSTPTLGLNYENDAISAVVIGGVSFVGGTGKISGVILGVFMMQLIITGMTFMGISGNVVYIIKGAVILFACILDMRKYMTRK
ncbi:MAG: beta-methylgalactoside transporter [Clostridia bacterium]|nr:beta-methylgalactoside transporter [Clostridia bacterium]